MSRKILFCTIGQSPQVVTETVWSLSRSPIRWTPTELHIVTTSKGLANVAKGLQHADSRLYDLLPKSVPVTVYVPKRDSADALPAFVLPPPGDGVTGVTVSTVAADPAALDDVRSEDDALLMGNVIYRLMAGFVSDPDSEIHVSLAGGRKTMSAHALVAYSMLGRPQDRASHVLVWPPEFEGNPHFWHKDQSEPVPVGRPQPAAVEPRLLDPKDAEIVLVDTPAPLVRDHLRNMNELLTLDFGTALKRMRIAQTLQTRPEITLDTASNSVVVAGAICVLSAPEFAVFSLIALAKRERWTGCGPDGFGEGHAGWLTRDQIAFGEAPDGRPIVAVLQDLRLRAEQATAPQDVFASEATVPEEIEKAVARFERIKSRRSLDLNKAIADQVAFAKNALETNVSKIRSAFRAKFGQAACEVLLPPNRSERRRWTGEEDRPPRGLPLGPAFRDLAHDDLDGGARIGTGVPASGIMFK